MTGEPDKTSPGVSRRKMLIGSGVAAGTAWIAPAVLSRDAAAAASGSPSTVTLVNALKKDPNGTAATRCVSGCTTNCSPAGRGDVSFTYTPALDQICVTITLASGPNITGRQVLMLQSDNTTCLSSAQIGTWAASPLDGPQTFCTTVVPGATRFTVHMPVSGGGGTDIYTSLSVCIVGGVLQAC